MVGVQLESLKSQKKDDVKQDQTSRQGICQMFDTSKIPINCEISSVIKTGTEIRFKSKKNDPHERSLYHYSHIKHPIKIPLHSQS